MANTVSLLSYANTFGDWVVTTNSLVKENNDLASNTYVKGVGTLFLNDPTLGLQVGSNSIFAGPVQVQGIGSSVYVQNNVQIDRQLNLTNTTQSIIASGPANVGGTIFATASGTGLSVSNNAIINGTTTLNNKVNVNANTVISNTLFVSGATSISNTIIVTGNISGNFLTTSSYANIGSTLNVVDTVYTAFLQANTRVNTPTLTVSGSSFTNTLQANTRVNTPTLTVTDVAYANVIQANNSVNTSTISVTNTTWTNNLQANTRVNTPTLTVTGTAYANVIQANTAMNVASITSSNDVFTKNLQANNVVQTQTLNVIGTEYVDVIVANTIISSPTLSVSTQLYANNASAYFNNIQTFGQFTVGGNFVLQGATVYSSNTFTLNANTTTASIAAYNVNRGSTGVGAAIRWNEPVKYWDILNVDSNSYFKILTSDLLTSSVTSTSTSNVATALAANTLNNSINTANTWLQANDGITLTSARSYTDSSNTQLKSYTDGLVSSSVSSANTQLKAYTDGAISSSVSSANTQLKAYTDGAITSANNQLKYYADGAISSANTQLKAYVDGYISYNNSVNTAQNTNITSANTQLKSYTDGLVSSSVSSANTQLKAYTDGAISSANTQLKAYTDGAITSANTQLKAYTDGKSANIGTTTIAFSRASAQQTLTGVNIDGNAGTVTNGVYTSGSYSNPSWLTSVLGSIVSGNISGSSSNITSYTINQSVGSANDVQFQSLGVGTAGSGTSGEIRAIGDITAYYSDDRLKTRLGNIENALDKVISLNGFYYQANETAQELGYTVRKEVGVSAQEVQNILPEIVVPAPIDDKYLTVHYERLIPLLIESIKELKNEIEDLKRR